MTAIYPDLKFRNLIKRRLLINGIITVENLIGFTRRELLKMKFLSPKVIDEIEKKLTDHNLSLKINSEGDI